MREKNWVLLRGAYSRMSELGGERGGFSTILLELLSTRQ